MITLKQVQSIKKQVQAVKYYGYADDIRSLSMVEGMVKRGIKVKPDAVKAICNRLFVAVLS